MERKVGEIFTYNGKTYQVIKTNACRDCAFKVRLCEALESITGTCIPGERTDNTNVSFKLINNMEIQNNQLTIDIPEEMEIDLENSDLTKGIVKFKKKYITYKDITDAIRPIITYTSISVYSHYMNKLKAISQLMNIARYYNGDWKYKVNGGERGYMIAYDNSIKEPPYYKVNVIYPTTDVYYGNPIFENDIDAQAVIDNPNFRDILDAIYKN